MAGVADSAVGAILEIPPQALADIKKAEAAIKSLQATSETAARKIKGHFDNTAVSGLNAFIQKIREAQRLLGSTTMPTIDATGFAASISQIAQAMATVDRSATTGANRISRIADSITKLSAAQPSAQMFQDIANGITAIGNTSQQTIQNVQMLAQTMAQLARDIRTVQNAQRAQANDTATAAQYNKLYKEQAQILREILAINRKGRDATVDELNKLSAMQKRYSEIEAQLDRLNRKKQTAATQLARVTGEANVGRTVNISSAKGAINYAQQAKSLRELQDAYKNLKAVMSTVDPKSAAWQQMNQVLQQTKGKIDEIRKTMGEFHSQSQRTAGVASQLRNTLAAAFSIAAIGGYIKKMVDVRAQFELQNVALRAILQNKDEADRIFAQVQQMALQSPFTIMQLTTYTKQLAAYRIEADKLVGTTKMLADVSAGLGVDIQRLILAYGQVKSANYLRATEIRQFTEAGLNIAGELAQYFSELQGKMVSVGDVMDMVTKRMVRFEDVEEVFKRVTSAGGLFYDMQKKQAETLSGQLQRIQDAYSIMMNEIGKSNQSTISEALATIRFLISNWRTLAKVIKVTGSGLVAFYLVFQSFRKTSWITSFATHLKALHRLFLMNIQAAGGLKAALMSMNFTGVGTLLAALGALAYAIQSLISSSSALSEELERVMGENMSDMYSSMYQFKDLAKTVTDATKPYEKRKEAMESLNRTYKDILPAEMLEIENIRKMSDGYTEATDAIREYYTEAGKKKAEESIANEVEQSWSILINHAKDMADYLKAGQPELKDMPTATLKGLIGKTMLELKAEIENGTTDVNDAWVRFKELFKSVSGAQLEDNFKTRGFRSLFGEWTLTWANFYDDITDIVKKSNAAMEEVEAQYAEGFSKETQAVIEDYNKRKTAVENFQKAMQNYGDLQQKGELMIGKMPTVKGAAAMNELEDAMGILNQYLESIGEAEIEWDAVTASTQNNTDALLFFDEVQKRVLGGFLKNLQDTADDTSLKAWSQKTERELRAAGLGDLQLDILNLAKESAKVNGIQMTMLDKLKVSANTNYSSAAQDAHKLSKAAEDNIKMITATKLQLIALGRTAAQAQAEAEAKHGNGSTEAELKAQMEFWDKLSQLYGYSEKKKGGKGADPWQKRVSLIKEMNTEYEKLLKYYDEGESKLRIQNSYAEAVAEAFKGIKANGKDLGDIKLWQGFDKEGMIAQLRTILDSGLTISKEKRAELQKMLARFKAEIEIKVRQDEIQKAKDDIQKAFDNYELTKTLGDIGLNVDLTYMVGGKPVTLSELRKQLEDALASTKVKGGNEELVKYYEEQLRKVADLENKAQKDRLKTYNKYFVKTVGDRARIELEYLKKMDEVRQMYEFTDAQRQDALHQLNAEKNKKLAEQVWKDFKDGSVYQMMFQDLDAMSEKTLITMRTELERIKDSFKGLSPQQLKEINKAIQDINNQIANRNPFKTLGTSFKNLIKFSKERKKLEKDYQDAIKRSGELADEIFQKETQLAQLRDKSALYKVDQVQSQIDNLKKQIAELEKDELTAEEQAKIDALNEQIKLLEEKKKKLQEIAALNKNEEDSMYSEIKGLESEVAGLNEELGKTKEKGSEASEGLSEGSVKAAAIKAAFNKIKQYAEETVSHIDGIISGLDRMGVLTDAARDNWESFKDGFEAVNDIAEGGVNVMTGYLTGNYADMVTGTLQGIKGTINLIASIFEVGDKKKERQIKSLKESVEALDNAYQKLEKSIESAYTFSQYNAEFDKAWQNLEEQKKAVEEMKALEESKKKSDKDDIKEYERQLEELAEKEEELRKQRIEAQGSTTDYLSEAQSFVDAWLDAYKETGNGLDALSESWEEFVENLFVKQGAAQIVSARLKKIIDNVNEAIEAGGTDLDLSETINKAREDWKKEAEIINPLLEELFGSYGLGKGNGDFILSDLQKGIQNITEPQAAAIEAYLNSMRFAVFRHTEQLDTLIATIQAQYGSGAENPVVTELKGIRGVLDNIYSTLRSVVKSGVGKTYIQVG